MSAQHTPDWSRIDPARIANTCSPRHVQSVLEDAQRTIARHLSTLEKARDALDSCKESTYSEQWTEQVLQRFDAQKVAAAAMAVRAAIAKATGSASHG